MHHILIIHWYSTEALFCPGLLKGTVPENFALVTAQKNTNHAKVIEKIFDSRALKCKQGTQPILLLLEAMPKLHNLLRKHWKYVKACPSTK